MTNNETELLDIVRNSDNPGLVAEFFFNLFSDYLRKHAPSQGTPFADHQESA